MADTTIDYLIIGGGPLGLSAAHSLSRHGNKKIVVCEKGNFYNASGSSSDFVRMFRTMYSEEGFAKLALAAKKSWENLEAESGTKLIEMLGLLNFGNLKYEDGPEGNLTRPIPIMDELGMKYEVLKADEIMKRYPFKNLPSDYEGVLAADNGVINVPLVVRTLRKLAESKGVEFLENTPVSHLEIAENGHVIATTDSQKITARKVIVTSGAYTNHVVKWLGFELALDIWEMTSAYFGLSTETKFPSMWFQFEVAEEGSSNLFYGFPEVSWGPKSACRIAVDWASRVIHDPLERHHIPAEKDVELTVKFVQERVRGADAHPQFIASCLMANVVDNGMVIDYSPQSVVGKHHKNVIVCAAGWAFKFVPIIGDILASLALEEESQYDISGCNIDRPGILKKPGVSFEANHMKARSVAPEAHSRKISAKAARGIKLKQ